jgi:putative transposase
LCLHKPLVDARRKFLRAFFIAAFALIIADLPPLLVLPLPLVSPQAAIRRSWFDFQSCLLYLLTVLFNELYFYTATIYKWKTLLRDFHFEPLVLESLSFLSKKECIRVYGFVIMPNHMHLIWELVQNNGKESPAASLMKFTAHRFEEHLKRNQPFVLDEYVVDWRSRKYNFWQPKPDWFLLNKEETLLQKLTYIHTNPMQEHWDLVKDPAAYPYSSARFYEHRINDFDFLLDYRDYKG